MLTPVPTTIIHLTLIQLQIEVRLNSKFIPSSLGRCAKGYLRLVKSASTYAHINPNAVFTYPNHAGLLVKVTNAMQFQIAETVWLHKETIGTFNLCNLIKRTTIQKIN